MQSEFLNKKTYPITGKDALDLLHRISTINIKSLSFNETTEGLILNSKGKIECTFLLTKITNESILIVTYGNKFLEILDHYTFGEQYKIETQSQILSSTQNPSETSRILSLRPRLGHEYLHDGQTNPLEVNLRNAIHDQKGCYPGQEIIEKIIAIGSPPKRLCLLSSSQEVSAPLPLLLFDLNTGVEAGSLTSMEGKHGLGIIKKTHTKEGLHLKSKDGTSFKIEKVST